MAYELGLTFVRLNCYVARPMLGGSTKTEAHKLLAQLETNTADDSQGAEEVDRESSAAGGA